MKTTIYTCDCCKKEINFGSRIILADYTFNTVAVSDDANFFVERYFCRDCAESVISNFNEKYQI